LTTILEGPVAQVGLAEAAMEAGTVDDAVAHLSAAIREFTAAGDRRQAAVTCARLGDLFAIFMGNLTAARAWFQRAIRLIEDEPPCIEQGWVAVAALGCDVDDPDVLLARAELALDRSRRFGDMNLETKALADAGLAHVQAGRLTEGMALLDEAMALACGLTDDAEAAQKSVCSFLTACYYAADFASGVPLLRARMLLDLVRLHDHAGNGAAATVEARRACAALAGLDVVLPAADVALLDGIGAASPDLAADRSRLTAVLLRQERGWLAVCGDTQVQLRNTKGLRYLAGLLRNPGVERHALDLVDEVEGLATGEAAVSRRHLGDAGELIDAEARRAYRRRIEALGGRARKAGSAAERARLNVTRALRTATAGVREALPVAGIALDRRLRTGLYCAYEPDDADRLRWIVQS
jgi:tetratricopeptide (TPR) repeat protein